MGVGGSLMFSTSLYESPVYSDFKMAVQRTHKNCQKIPMLNGQNNLRNATPFFKNGPILGFDPKANFEVCLMGEQSHPKPFFQFFFLKIT